MRKHTARSARWLLPATACVRKSGLCPATAASPYCRHENARVELCEVNDIGCIKAYPQRQSTKRPLDKLATKLSSETSVTREEGGWKRCSSVASEAFIATPRCLGKCASDCTSPASTKSIEPNPKAKQPSPCTSAIDPNQADTIARAREGESAFPSAEASN